VTGPLAKVDALLSARLAPWLELSAPKAPAGAGEAPPVTRSPRVENEVLLPTRTGLHPQAGMEPRAALRGDGAQAGAGSTALSAAARAILAVESDMHAGQAGPVRGHVALWAARRAPDSVALASTLSQQVSGSGLFYESHLAEFATGARSLAQMQREPQAGLARAADAAGDEAQAPAQLRHTSNLLPAASPQAQTLALPAAATPPLVALMAATPSQPGVQQPGDALPHEATAAANGQTEPQTVQEHHAANRASEYALSRFAQVAASAVQQDAPQVMDRALAHSAAADAPAAVAVVHPQAAAVVHQQLDLLASATFRWSGEAWPGVAMEWAVQEEGARHQANEPGDDQPHWSTTVMLELPRLGSVKVGLKLSGSTVHAQLAAVQAEAIKQLRTGGSALTQRLSGAGLQLQSLQFESQGSAA